MRVCAAAAVANFGGCLAAGRERAERGERGGAKQ
eukprot:SAG31_NODE_5227_length_2662_cov_3.874756_1_plen_33_part_10